MPNRQLPQLLNALPPFVGGKRRLLSPIFAHLEAVIPSSDWSQRRFLDVFAGGGSISLFAKTQGFQQVLSNDWSNRTQILFEALLKNQTQKLTAEDLLFLTQALPDGTLGSTETQLVSHILAQNHAQALDRIRYWSHQYQDPIKRNLGLLLLWHILQDYVCMPTSINTSNRPYAEILDGLRDWQQLNPKRFVDQSFPRMCVPRWTKLESLRKQINAGVIGGSPVQTFQMDACDFLQSQKGDIAYLDPPYPGTLSYESSLKTLDAILLGTPIEQAPNISMFSKGVSALKPLLESARHIPLWILSYGNNCIDLAGLIALVQDLGEGRAVYGYEKTYQHLAHVSKSPDRKELLIVAY